MTNNVYDETKAVARLPHLDVEVFHRRAQNGESELLSVTLRGSPSFEAFGQFVEATNPLSLWMGMMQAVWSPWLGLLGATAPQLLSGPAARFDKESASRP